MRTAKEGEKISTKARERLAGLMRIPVSFVPQKVQPKRDGQQGQWVCADCGEPFPNNMSAMSHGDEKPKHRLAWRGATGDLEQP